MLTPDQHGTRIFFGWNAKNRLISRRGVTKEKKEGIRRREEGETKTAATEAAVAAAVEVAAAEEEEKEKKARDSRRGASACFSLLHDRLPLPLLHRMVPKRTNKRESEW